MTDSAFRKLVLTHFRIHGRHDLPWRRNINPYRILVSEIMLQQTQVPRVIEKYTEFLKSFPTFRALADAPTARVLKAWQGLGYNRRALMLQRCARAVIDLHGGNLPDTHTELCALPGIGPYTAGALLAFAFDAKHPVIETNIRRVYLHHFFPGRRNVADATILPLVTKHLGQVRSARQWYGALMDYGTHLATQVPNPNRRSRHHVRQAAFEGSLRQLRGTILRHLTQYGQTEHAALASVTGDSRFGHALAALEKEGFVRIVESVVHLVA
jgi:A/G-specific adenine glycosylase